MKIPKLIETMTWVFSMDGRIPKPDPLRFSEISMELAPKDPECVTLLTAQARFQIRAMVDEKINPEGFGDIPIQLRRSLLREIYGEVIEELRDLEFEAYQHSIMFNSTLSDRIGEMITVLETGERTVGSS